MSNLRLMPVIASSGLLVLSGCTIENRLLSTGYYVDWKHTVSDVMTEHQGAVRMASEMEEPEAFAFFEDEVQATAACEGGGASLTFPTIRLEPAKELRDEDLEHARAEVIPVFNLAPDTIESELKEAHGLPPPRLDAVRLEPERWYSTISMGRLLLICLPIVCYPPLILRYWDRKRVEKNKPRLRKWVRVLLWLHWAVYFAAALFAVVIIVFIW